MKIFLMVAGLVFLMAMPVRAEEKATAPKGNGGFVVMASPEQQEERVKFKDGPESQVKGWWKQIKDSDAWMQKHWW